MNISGSFRTSVVPYQQDKEEGILDLEEDNTPKDNSLSVTVVTCQQQESGIIPSFKTGELLVNPKLSIDIDNDLVRHVI